MTPRSPIVYIDFPSELVPRWFFGDGQLFVNGRPFDKINDVFKLITVFGFGIAWYYDRGPDGSFDIDGPRNFIARSFVIGRIRFVPLRDWEVSYSLPGSEWLNTIVISATTAKAAEKMLVEKFPTASLIGTEASPHLRARPTAGCKP